MPGLPLSNQQWPPRSMEEPYNKMSEWAAWYSGEPMNLIDFYARTSPLSNRPFSPWYRFWTRARQADTPGFQRALMHVPIASDLAATSAALLFGEPPRVRIKEAHENEDPNEQQDAADPQNDPVAQLDPISQLKNKELEAQSAALDKQLPPKPKPKVPETPAQKTEARLLELIERGDVMSRLLEAAETSAAIGGVYIYPAWDKNFRDEPFVAVAQADMAVPEFRFGFLHAVTFHRIVRVDDDSGNVVYRHLERHEVQGEGDGRKAHVLHGAYKGTQGNLGQRVALSVIKDEIGDLPDDVEMPFPELDVEYIPNIRPNRLWRASGLGVADVQGSETLLDALDETYASWQRDIRLAKARIIVPREYLTYERDADGNVAGGFDLDQEIYTPMEMEPTLQSDSRMMLAHQFNIRHEEHRATAAEYISRVVSNAGYSPQTLGHQSSGGGNQPSQTGTAMRVEEHKTLLTLRRKGAWWKVAMSNLFYHLQLIDKEEFGGQGEPIRPMIEMSDSIIDQPLELAQTALALKSAEAASTETRVRLVNPTWTDAEIASEVERIQGEVSATQPPIAFGNPNAAQESTGNFPNKGVDKSKAPKNAPPPAPPFAKKA